MDWQTFKCRCSKISDLLAASRDNPCLTENQEKELSELRAKLESGKVLTANQQAKVAEMEVKEKNKDKIILSSGCLEYLAEYYAWETAKKMSVGKELNMIEYTEKGLAVEEASITLISLIDEVYYQKNTERIANEFLSGEPDLFIGENILKATKITDIKSSFDYPIFLKTIKAGVNQSYVNQVAGYMDITGAKEGEIAYCLVSMPPAMVNDYRWRLARKMGVVTDEAPEFLKAAEIMEKSLIFDDIPKQKRVYKVPVQPFTPEQQQKVYDRVKVCREWLHNFHTEMEQLNK